MKDIYIYVLHPAVNSVEQMIKLFNMSKLSLKYNFVWSKEKPQYVIVSEHIYYKNKYFKELKKYFNEGLILIYWAGECIAPDMNIFDYAVCWDINMQLNDRIVRVPPAKEFFSSFVISDRDNGITKEKAEELFEKKNKFCCFIYSNPQAHFMRDAIFYKISEYKRVDSLGKHLNNVGTEGTGYENHRKETTTLKDNYKFSIAAENAVYDGYVSEKLLTSLQAHTVPIYFGSPYISEQFNPEAFIDVNKFDNLDGLLDEVRRIDASKEAWCNMIRQPWQTEEQVKKDKKQMEDYIAFWDNIFGKNFEECHRKPTGCNPNKYKEWFFRSSNYELEIHNKIRQIKRVFKRLYKKLNA